MTPPSYFSTALDPFASASTQSHGSTNIICQNGIQEMEHRMDLDIDGAPVIRSPSIDGLYCGDLFLCLRYLFWGLGQPELQRICTEEKAVIPEYSVDDEPIFDQRKQPQESEEYQYTVLDIRNGTRYQSLPLDIKEEAGKLLPCVRKQFMVLDDYVELYNIICAKDNQGKKKPPIRRYHGFLRDTPGIGMLLNSPTL
jgi:hypothetical protein